MTTNAEIERDADGEGAAEIFRGMMMAAQSVTVSVVMLMFAIAA